MAKSEREMKQEKSGAESRTQGAFHPDEGRNMLDEGTRPEMSYLLFAHYGIHGGDDMESIICRAGEKAFLYFCRRISFYGCGPVDERQRMVKETNRLLAVRIPDLLEAAVKENASQTVFDERHKAVCEEMRGLFEEAGGMTYGVAQRWLNQTLMNLVVIDSCTTLNGLNLKSARKYFHVSVDESIIRVASERRAGRYSNALNLPCAPYREEDTDSCRMSWYRRGTTLSFESWDYPEYIKFQTMIRGKLRGKADDSGRTCTDPLDWAFRAYTEAAKPRYLGR